MDRVTGIRVSRGSAEPLYTQIRQAVLEKIESGEWPPHYQLPTYKGLSAEMGVSIITIQHSIGALVKEGVLYRKRGVGVFTAPPQSHARTQTIALLLPDIRHSFFSSLAYAIQTYAARHQYTTLLFSVCGASENSVNAAKLLPRQALDGVITSYAVTEHLPLHFSNMLKATKPVVFVDGFSPDYDCVETDNYLGVQMALEHLIELGHQRIAFAAGQILTKGVHERIDAFRSILRARSLPCEPPQVQISVQADDMAGEETAHTLLSLRDVPTAVLCMNDLVARGVMRAARERGISCSEQLSVIGFDDLDFARHLDPPLTTIRQPIAEIGQTAVDLLLERIDDPGGQNNRHKALQLRPELVVRASTGPAPPSEL
jgi:DNA-binding LacI/PurR family transcriptional regulator